MRPEELIKWLFYLALGAIALWIIVVFVNKIAAS
jgi:hypothetical protein